VRGEPDLSATMPRPHKDRTLEPVLMLDKNGALAAAMLSVSAPFPAKPSVSGKITKIEVSSSDKEKTEEREQVTDIKPLAVKIDGKDAAPWSYEQLAKLTEGKEKRDTWSLREAAKQLVGPKARVVALVNGEDERMELDKAMWADESRTPNMRVNRQGLFKFSWSGANPMQGGDAQLRNVRAVELVNEK